MGRGAENLLARLRVEIPFGLPVKTQGDKEVILDGPVDNRRLVPFYTHCIFYKSKFGIFQNPWRKRTIPEPRNPENLRTFIDYNLQSADSPDTLKKYLQQVHHRVGPNERLIIITQNDVPLRLNPEIVHKTLQRYLESQNEKYQLFIQNQV